MTNYFFMPNRILREGILTSERVNTLKPHLEVFYRRLMSVVDDFGLYDGRPSILRASCYPLQLDHVSESDVTSWLNEIEQAGLVRCYWVEGKPYIQLLDFRQQLRAKHSKYPHPPSPDARLPDGCVADAKQMIASAHLVGIGDGVDKSSPQGRNIPRDKLSKPVEDLVRSAMNGQTLTRPTYNEWERECLRLGLSRKEAKEKYDYLEKQKWMTQAGSQIKCWRKYLNTISLKERSHE